MADAIADRSQGRPQVRYESPATGIADMGVPDVESLRNLLQAALAAGKTGG